MTRALIVDGQLAERFPLTGSVQVHSVFTRTVNLLNGEFLFTIAQASVPPAPRTIIVDRLPGTLVPSADFDLSRIDWDNYCPWNPQSPPAKFSTGAISTALELLSWRRPAGNAFEAAILHRIENSSVAEDPARACDLVGLGTGLTPGGDDYLAGFLVGAAAAGNLSLVRAVSAAIDLEQTNDISRAMLTEAMAGRASRPLHDLLHTVGKPRHPLGALRRSLDEVLLIGHTSGYLLARGLLAALQFTYPQKEGIDVDHDSRQTEYVH